jgi:hypothetical protein
MAEGTTDTGSPGVRKVYQPAAEPIDVLEVAGPALARRIVIGAGIAAALAVIVLALRGRRR